MEILPDDLFALADAIDSDQDYEPMDASEGCSDEDDDDEKNFVVAEGVGSRDPVVYLSIYSSIGTYVDRFSAPIAAPIRDLCQANWLPGLR